VKSEIIEKIERVVETLQQEMVVLARVTDLSAAGGSPTTTTAAAAAAVSQEASKHSVLTSAAAVSATHLVKKQSEELDAESVKQMRIQTVNTSPGRAPPGLVESRNNMNSVNDNANSDIMRSQTNESKNVRSDFTSPYNSQQQVLMWKNWGKDIDWGKMKFQGNSDIYSKAQEDQSKGSNSALRKVKIESDLESAKKRSHASSPLTAMPILSSDPPRREGERLRAEGEKEKASTVKATFKGAAPRDNKSKKEKEKEKTVAVVMIVREVPVPVPAVHRHPNRPYQWGVVGPAEVREREREGKAVRGRVDIITAAAATVLVPPIP
jgi:hypothetical protein